MTDEEQKRIEEHVTEYRRLCDRVHFPGVLAALNFWADWQETTGRILRLGSKSMERGKKKISDAKQRRAERAKIAERAKK